jgi:signal transduction histidine kinase
MERLLEVREKLARVEDPLGLLEAIFAFAPIALQIYTREGRSLLTNQAFRDLFGVEPPPEYCVLDDDIAQRRGLIDLIRRGFAGETTSIPLTWYDPRELTTVSVPTGRRVAIETTIVPLFRRDGTVGHVAFFFKDMTAEMRAREAAEDDRARLLALLRALPEGIVVVAADGSVTFANDAARALIAPAGPCGRWDEVTRGLAVRRTDGAPVCDEDRPIRRALARGEVTAGLELTYDGPGGERTLLVHAAPRRDAAGRIVEAIAVFSDITARRRLEAELEEASRRKDELLSIASHELRTPLTTIKAAIQAAQRKLGAAWDEGAAAAVAAALPLVERAERQAARMTRLILDLLDLSRLSTGRVEYRLERRDLRPLLEAAVEALRTTHATHPITLVLPPEEVRANVDADRIEQVLANLVGNAVRYSPCGAEISVKLERADGLAAISVADRGIGIKEEELPHVFERFYRGSPPVARRTGLGLGLFIASEIVHAHGGRIEARSEPGKGSTFTVLLPAA